MTRAKRREKWDLAYLESRYCHLRGSRSSWVKNMLCVSGYRSPESARTLRGTTKYNRNVARRLQTYGSVGADILFGALESRAGRDARGLRRRTSATALPIRIANTLLQSKLTAPLDRSPSMAWAVLSRAPSLSS